MWDRTPRLVVVASLLLSGCISGPTPSGATSAVRTSWDRLTGSGKADSGRQWDWTTAVPTGGARAETVPPVIPAAAVAELVPELKGQEVRLASTGGTAALTISAINGNPVNNYNQLNSAATRALDLRKNVTVSLSGEGPSSSPAVVTEVVPSKLVALGQAAAPQEPVLRVTADGNPWVLIREGGIRCKVMARVERTRGVMHVAVALGNSWGAPVTLPGEIHASCNGVPLQCLTVAETLETFFGAPKTRRANDSHPPEKESFCKVSEQDDYLMPTNYRRLQRAADEAAKDSSSPPPLPAFATLPGIEYPGPAILGDARALSGFLLQRQIYQAGESERVGWLIFSGDELRRGGAVQIIVDLGHGPHQLMFSLSKP
jgi:hypothetical protein